MSVAYITCAPTALKLSDLSSFQTKLVEKGWSPTVSPVLWSGQTQGTVDRPLPAFVRSCLVALSRSEMLLCLGDEWDDFEICRIERQFAEDNNIIVKEGDPEEIQLPNAGEFSERFMKIGIRQELKHAHPSVVAET